MGTGCFGRVAAIALWLSFDSLEKAVEAKETLEAALVLARSNMLDLSTIASPTRQMVGGRALPSN